MPAGNNALGKDEHSEELSKKLEEIEAKKNGKAPTPWSEMDEVPREPAAGEQSAELVVVDNDEPEAEAPARQELDEQAELAAGAGAGAAEKEAAEPPGPSTAEPPGSSELPASAAERALRNATEADRLTAHLRGLSPESEAMLAESLGIAGKMAEDGALQAANALAAVSKVRDDRRDKGDAEEVAASIQRATIGEAAASAQRKPQYTVGELPDEDENQAVLEAWRLEECQLAKQAKPAAPQVLASWKQPLGGAAHRLVAAQSADIKAMEEERADMEMSLEARKVELEQKRQQLHDLEMERRARRREQERKRKEAEEEARKEQARKQKEQEEEDKKEKEKEQQRRNRQQEEEEARKQREQQALDPRTMSVDTTWDEYLIQEESRRLMLERALKEQEERVRLYGLEAEKRLMGSHGLELQEQEEKRRFLAAQKRRLEEAGARLAEEEDSLRAAQERQAMAAQVDAQEESAAATLSVLQQAPAPRGWMSFAEIVGQSGARSASQQALEIEEERLRKAEDDELNILERKRLQVVEARRRREEIARKDAMRQLAIAELARRNEKARMDRRPDSASFATSDAGSAAGQDHGDSYLSQSFGDARLKRSAEQEDEHIKRSRTEGAEKESTLASAASQATTVPGRISSSLATTVLAADAAEQEKDPRGERGVCGRAGRGRARWRGRW